MNNDDGKVCGVCGVGVRLNKNGLPAGGMYLCDTHRPYPTNCTQCPLVVLCNDRVIIYHLWVLCETPTVDDFERSKMNNTPDTVAFPFKHNPTLIKALFPNKGVRDGEQAKPAQEKLYKQSTLPNIGNSPNSG